MRQHLQIDVTDVVNGLVMRFAPEDFARGVTSDRVVGRSFQQQATMGVNVDVSAVWFAVDQQNLRPQKVDGVCRPPLSGEGYFLPDLETMPIECEHVGNVKVFNMM